MMRMTMHWAVDLTWTVWGLGVAVGMIERRFGFALTLGPLDLIITFSSGGS